MRLCGEGIIGLPVDEQYAKDVAQQAVDLGVDFIDTADSYGPGVSERLLREAIDTDDVTIEGRTPPRQRRPVAHPRRSRLYPQSGTYQL